MRNSSESRNSTIRPSSVMRSFWHTVAVKPDIVAQKPILRLDTIEAAVLKHVLKLTHGGSGWRLVDAPCGKGALAGALQQKGFSVIGLDIDRSAEDLLGG